MLTKEDIRRLIPHAFDMCLLDTVTAWDAQSISCVSLNHGSAMHPLRHAQRLAAVHLIEYGAQAAAIHGALLESEAQSVAVAKPGMLAAVRGLNLAVPRIDLVRGPLNVRARKLLARADGLVYEFEASDAQQVLLGGARITIVLRPA